MTQPRSDFRQKPQAREIFFWFNSPKPIPKLTLSGKGDICRYLQKQNLSGLSVSGAFVRPNLLWGSFPKVEKILECCAHCYVV
jgi:hypothetical protein